MADAVQTILTGISTIITSLFSLSAGEPTTLGMVACLPIVGGIVGKVVSVVRRGRG